MPADHNALVRYAFTRDQSSIYFRKEDGDFDKISVHGNKSTSNFAAVKASASPNFVKVAIVVSIVVLGLAIVAGAIAVAVVFSTQDDGDKNNTDGQTSGTTTSSFSGVSTADSTTESSDRPESSTTSNINGGSTTYSTGRMTSSTIYQNATGGTSTQSTDSGTKGWSPWGSWTTCTASCGSGIHKRYRSCNEDLSTACNGDYVESEICFVTPCQVYGQWTTWTTWGSCDVTCGGGVMSRSRTCSKTDSSDLNCVGAASQQTSCSAWNCPDCSQTCTHGTLNTACDACTCIGQNITGRVIAEGTSYPITNAAIYAATAPTTLLSLSDSLGNFALNTTCLTTKLLVSRTGFQDITIEIKTSYQEITMMPIILPYLVQQPKSKRRLVGESVTFCCSAMSRPNISYYEWFKDSVLVSGNSSNITLQDLSVGHQGSYQCRANSPVGAIMSSAATLIIKETPDEFCADALQQKSIALPDDCIQPSTNTAIYEVGECIAKSCRGNDTSDDGSCNDDVRSCCSTAEADLETVQCSGYELEIVVVKSCACSVCNTNIITISGLALSDHDSLPVKFAEVWVNGIFTAFTSIKGTFNFVASKLTSKITINIQDKYSKRLLPAVKVVTINDDMSGTLNINIRMFKANDPVPIVSTVPNTLAAGASSNDPSVPVVEISIPPNAFFYQNGTAFIGTLNASLTFLDPRNTSVFQNIPGVFNFVDEEGQSGNLASLGVFNLFFSDNSGNPLILDEVIDVYVPNELNTTDKDIKLWKMNTETGLWEIIITDSGLRRRKRQITKQWIGEIDWSTVSFGGWFNVDYIYKKTNYLPCYFKVRLFKDATLTENVPKPERYISLEYHFIENNVFKTVSEIIWDPEDTCLEGICEHSDAYITLFYYGRKGYEEMFAGHPKLGSQNTPYQITDGEKVLKIQMSSSVAGPFFENWSQCIVSSSSSNYLRYHFGKATEVYTLLEKFQFSQSVPIEEQIKRSRRAWYPEREEGYRVCFLKVRVLFEANTQLRPGQYIKFRVTSLGGTNSNIADVILGIREFKIDNVNNAFTQCIDYKCSGIISPMLSPEIDYTKVKVKLIYPESDIKCAVTKEADFVNSDQTGRNVNQIGKAEWEVFAPTNYGPSIGLYSATSDKLDLDKIYDTANKECISGEQQVLTGSNPEKGLGLTFTCGNVDGDNYWWYG